MLGLGAAPLSPHLGSPPSESVFVLLSSGSQIERDYWVLESICTFQQTLDVSYTLCLKVVQGSWLEIKETQNLASVAKMTR